MQLGPTVSVSLGTWTRVMVLGEGSQGKVFLGKPTLGPIYYVAVKAAFIAKSSSLAIEKDILQHFVGCPEIIQCIGDEITLEESSICYNLILEYAAGGTLANLIKKQRKLPENLVKEYLKMILRGLSCIHSKGFVHSDLKPANILAFPQGDGKMKLKIADFGLSKRWVHQDHEVVLNTTIASSKPKFKGTPIYMSPESVVLGSISPPCDIWSLGCILVEMITGKRVWESCQTIGEFIKKLVHEMELPADIPEELSREGRDFLASCFDHDPQRRWTANIVVVFYERYRVNYGLNVDNLPQRSDVINVYGRNEDIHSFATDQMAANAWVNAHVLPYYVDVNIAYITVGNEVVPIDPATPFVAIGFTYNKNFMNHVASGAGTPKRPNVKYNGILFEMFNEDLKAAGVEQNRMQLGSTVCVSLGTWTRVMVLGEGSHGIVFLAKPTMGPIYYVAVKVAFITKSSSLVIEKDILQHFIGCPEIIQCIGDEITLEESSLCYNLILEYAAGGTLVNLIKKEKKLPENQVKEYLKMILRGLSCIHSKGFVHSDLKPTNILAFPRDDGKMKLKIADFELSKRWVHQDHEVVLNTTTASSKPKFKGTPIYMSPESVVLGSISPPCDIWSLGCILVEMITGKQVWKNCQTSGEFIKKLVHEMELPADIPEELSREGRDFLASCFDHDLNEDGRLTYGLGNIEVNYGLNDDNLLQSNDMSISHTLSLATKSSLPTQITKVVHISATGVSYPPFAGAFTIAAARPLSNIAKVVGASGVPLLLNVYPYFAYTSNLQQIPLNYTLFTSTTSGVVYGNLNYYNLFDVMVDSFYAVLEKISAATVRLYISKTR
ncbi:ribosomal protein S6 kinase alpha-5-like [Momordica charantia]|uniref:glucan endo-1,3-beta-D-glucosidase n=1 Tax=Momordica charantia TaxID=3673 RepID=A0A6J1DDK5_MOMCH|nr:ribosomal protein S6 kinase alpha-5-like [Momordica charantia]